MPRSFSSLRAVCGVLALAGAGCATDGAPPPPYMTPYPAGGYEFGYADERLGADLWRVVYHGPWRTLDLDPGPRRAQIDRAASEAADLALWRAAQIALAANKPAFSIVDRRTDTETHRRRGAFVDDPWWQHTYYAYGRGRFIPRPWPSSYYVPGDASGRARATLTIRLEGRAAGAGIDAAATVRRLEPIYGPRAPAKP